MSETTKPEESPAPAPTDPDVAEREQAAAPTPAAEPEVRPEEFTAGVGTPTTGSAWPYEVIDELAKPLDPNRIRTRKGRGRGHFEYLAGHDVKRRASQIFGFGNWGHTIVEQAEIGAVQVTDDSGRQGWHVGYRCVVEVWVERDDGTRWTSTGSGYGDGVEYTAAARVTAQELALKESETDALKRALTDLGDQFGLILYAKADEKARIARESNVNATTGVVRRDLEPNVPRSFAEGLTRLSALFGGPNDEADAIAKEWLREAVEAKYAVDSIQSLPAEQRKIGVQKLGSTVILLEERFGQGGFPPVTRNETAAAFAERWDGLALTGPGWRLDSGEDDRLPYAEWLANDPGDESDGSAEDADDPRGVPDGYM